MFFFIPFFYSFHTRLKTINSRLAWVFTYLIPVLLVGFFLNVPLFLSFIVILSVYTVYEIGYIFNDCELIKKEAFPTIRVTDQELCFYENNKYLILLFRFVLIFFILTIVFYLYFDFLYSCFFTLSFILFIYFIYNSNRNLLNLPLYSCLVFLRYFGFLFFIHDDLFLFFILFLLYPLCVTIEFSSKKRFVTSRFIVIKSFDGFRCYYYLVLLIFSLLFYLLEFKYSEMFLLATSYFFVYRLFSYLFLVKKVRGRG